MRGLFLKIYLTFVIGLFMASCASGIVTFLLIGGRGPEIERKVLAVTTLFGIGASEESRIEVSQALLRDGVIPPMLAKTAADLGFEVALLDASGRSSDGNEMDAPGKSAIEKLRSGEPVFISKPPVRAYAPVLKSGSLAAILVFRPHLPPDRKKLLRPALWLFGLLFGLALLTYPLARGMGRRLDRLTDGAHRIASGELGTRVDVKGSDEIGRLASAMNEMAAQLEALIRGQKELVAAVSHELRSPLSRAKLSLELARSTDSPSGRLEEIGEDLAELERLVEELLLSSKLELSDFPMTAERLSLGNLLREVAARYSGIELDIADVVIEGDPRLLSQLMGNLIENGLRYTPEGQPIEISLRHESGRALLRVRDRGPGIAEEDRERIFEPFYRTDPSRSRQSGGAGLGLAIARRIALRHGGNLALEEVPEGACFLLDLPLSEGAVPS